MKVYNEKTLQTQGTDFTRETGKFNVQERNK